MVTQNMTQFQKRINDNYKQVFQCDMATTALNLVEQLDIDSTQALEEHAHHFSAGEFDAIEWEFLR